jgi:hypothetical protein
MINFAQEPSLGLPPNQIPRYWMALTVAGACASARHSEILTPLKSSNTREGPDPAEMRAAARMREWWSCSLRRHSTDTVL